jgi:AAA+ ATPase superfamily predicted ATPase
MKLTKFVNRIEELKSLDNKWKNDEAQFIVIYGRRRIGKTELIKKFMKEKKGIYFLGRLESKKDQLERISVSLSNFFSDPVLKKSVLNSWDAVFEYINEKNTKFVLAIDEFPYVVKTSPEILSILQDYWDNKLRYSKIFIILCGSSLSMMEKYVFDYKTPIYGRRTLDIKVPSLTFDKAREFFPYLDLEEAIKTYGVLGGTPAYLLEFEKDLYNTIKKICSKQSFLLREPEFILREEVTEPRLFFSILHAISIGKTISGEIVNQTGLDKGVVGKYLSVLSDLELIGKDLPITASWKSRKGAYFIQDNFFNFWFRFIYPNLEYIETDPDVVIRIIKRDINEYLGLVFEKICKQFLIRKQIMPSVKIGKWWHKEREIDIVALDENKKKMVFVECKWKDLTYNKSLKILEELKEKATFVKWLNDNRLEQYGIIARKLEDKDKLKRKGFLAYDLKDWK